MNRIYPAIFTKEETGKFAVEFPDLEGCLTCGDSFEDAMKNASEALGLYLISALEEDEDIPTASDIKEIVCAKDEIKTYVVADMENNQDYRNKTVTIPIWLDTIAQKQKINFSSTLREALISKIV
ncbi:MAG: type II toxin-antitoxin system HicB family antitoxin [Dialister micraerophilus]|uniref:type II toxin-antitoxin system HicB family antitoxin n=1 Tax=Dialister micraerophilus TaxID=309120 RepID=UPI00254B4162|nr:type II toxin-antitoxin system HicB family antitoxin [Dialister micraerophilus]MDK8254131.1 type II toxin-antitoxin system HicB family antitoxin [Dialister micraerophilus]